MRIDFGTLLTLAGLLVGIVGPVIGWLYKRLEDRRDKELDSLRSKLRTAEARLEERVDAEERERLQGQEKVQKQFGALEERFIPRREMDDKLQAAQERQTAASELLGQKFEQTTGVLSEIKQSLEAMNRRDQEFYERFGPALHWADQQRRGQG